MEKSGALPAPEQREPKGPHLLFERRLWDGGYSLVAGADEVGRGPLAGPVVAAAVVFAPGVSPDDLRGVNDSKRLSAAARERLAPRITSLATSVSIAVIDAAEIDRLNILVAAWEAMRQALAGLPVPPEHVLVDGPRNRRLPWPQTPIIGGDGLSMSIAAASVLAKVHRDQLMEAWDGVYPGYGFAQHKGYPTPAHRQALARLGPCPLHRRSFHWA